MFFTYTASFSGPVKVSLCTPSGFTAGSLADNVVAVYSNAACGGGGAPLACNDDSCASRAETTFTAVQGLNYLIRAGSWSTTLRASTTW